MKKIILSLMFLGMFFSITSSDLFARGIGFKGTYIVPRGEMDKQGYDAAFSYGLFFDMGTFAIKKLRFKPGFDYASFDHKSNNGADFEVWSIHLDWYWYFMGNSTISPFLGFGPTLNYYDGDRFNNNNDSDAGLDLFAGAAMGIAGTPFELFLEGRYKFYDIADTDWTAFSAGVGLQYRF